MPDFIMIPSKYDEIPAFITANLRSLRPLRFSGLGELGVF